MNYKKIKRLQREMGYDYWQVLVDSGLAWNLEGSVGREAMNLLREGAIMLPKKEYVGFYGNRIPSRDYLVKGSTGTFRNSVNFYSNINQ